MCGVQRGTPAANGGFYSKRLRTIPFGKFTSVLFIFQKEALLLLQKGHMAHETVHILDILLLNQTSFNKNIDYHVFLLFSLKKCSSNIHRSERGNHDSAMSPPGKEVIS